MTQRRPWTPEQDRILKYLREEEKVKKWSEIARILESTYQIFGRNQKQCRQRYQNHLNSQIVTQKLSEQEEKLLFRLHDEHGNKWSVIANNFPGRTDNSLKNHFHSKLRGAVRKINRYLGCKKKRGTKVYPLSIVYKIVKYFGQGNRKDGIQESQGIIMICLKNSLLKFGGANVEWQDQDWDQKNEKKMAQKIINLLQKFQNISRPCFRKLISQISDEFLHEAKENKFIKTQQAIPQNSDQNDFQLFRTFSQNSMLEKRSSLKQSQQRIETPIILKTHSNCKSFNKTPSAEEPELQFEKLDILKKKPSQSISQVDSDIRKLVQQKSISTISNGNNRLGMQKLTSNCSYSMQMVEQSDLRRHDSITSRASNIWVKQFDFQNKLDSCIFQ